MVSPAPDELLDGKLFVAARLPADTIKPRCSDSGDSNCENGFVVVSTRSGSLVELQWRDDRLSPIQPRVPPRVAHNAVPREWVARAHAAMRMQPCACSHNEHVLSSRSPSA